MFHLLNHAGEGATNRLHKLPKLLPRCEGTSKSCRVAVAGVECSNNRKQLCKPEAEEKAHFRQTEDFSIFQES